MMDHSRTGVLFIECCAFSPPNIPSFSLQPKSSSSSLHRTCSQNASGLTGWASASFWCRILWPECSRGLLLRSLHGMKAKFVQVWLDSVSLLCLPHLPGGLLQPNRVLTCYCSCPMSNFLFSSSCLDLYWFLLIDIKIRPAQQNTRAVNEPVRLTWDIRSFLTKARSTHQTNQLKGISTVFCCTLSKP